MFCTREKASSDRIRSDVATTFRIGLGLGLLLGLALGWSAFSVSNSPTELI